MKKKNVFVLAILLFSVVAFCASDSVYAETLVAWGYNGDGQCDVPAGNDYVAIADSNDHGLALKSDGSLVAWGSNIDSRCDIPLPNNNFTAISAGGVHSLGLRADGYVKTWGGLGWYVPPPAIGEEPWDVIAIAAGGVHSLMLMSDGLIVGWGPNNDFGQIGPPPPPADFIAIAAGRLHSLALRANGSVVAYGWEGSCDVPPEAGSDVVAISAGYGHSLALKSDGSIVGWGTNDYGQATPPAGNDFTAIAAGYNHSLALKSDGSIVGWGNNDYGQATPPAGTGFIAIAAGYKHSLALRVEVTTVTIDIKPGSEDNTISLGTQGLIPVAIFTEVDSDGQIVFNATTVDPETVEIGGMGVAIQGKGNNLMAYEQDVDDDGFDDLVVHVATVNFDPEAVQEGMVVLIGSTYNNLPIEGWDFVTIVPAE